MSTYMRYQLRWEKSVLFSGFNVNSNGNWLINRYLNEPMIVSCGNSDVIVGSVSWERYSYSVRSQRSKGQGDT